jgi:DNA-directed RNA polymerase sigma subunit (sigma70/sigma32)
MQKLIDRMHDTMYNVLRPEHKDCVCEYYGLNERGRRMSMIKIGAERGISRQRVHKIISESLSALVSPIEMLLND